MQSSLQRVCSLLLQADCEGTALISLIVTASFYMEGSQPLYIMCASWHTAAPSLVVVVLDEQGDASESQEEFEGYDKDILHNGNGFIS